MNNRQEEAQADNGLRVMMNHCERKCRLGTPQVNYLEREFRAMHFSVVLGVVLSLGGFYAHVLGTGESTSESSITTKGVETSTEGVRRRHRVPKSSMEEFIDEKSEDDDFTTSTASYTTSSTTSYTTERSAEGDPALKCVSTAPRLNLKIDMILGEWYPAKVSQLSSKLWLQSFNKQHSRQLQDISCLRLVYSLPTTSDPDILQISLQSANESTSLEALFVGDEHHPKASKWAIAWPNGEDTLTSVVAGGVLGKEKNRYMWLLTVDCDLNGLVEPDWAVIARVPERLSNQTLATILAIVEGLKGLTVENSLAYQSDDCHSIA